MKSRINLIDKENDIYNVKEQILKNRGVKDVNGYLNLNPSVLHDVELLGIDKLEKLKEKLEDCFIYGNKIYILVDTDCDGYCSASMLYIYLTRYMELENVEYIINKGKVHGLTDEVVETILSGDTSVAPLVLIPDAGTNDVKQCKVLSEKCNVFVLDHHPQELNDNGELIVNEYATVINPKCCDYPNKELCGAGVVYKVLHYLDKTNGTTFAENLKDLMAVAMIADSMDLREFESRYLVSIGLYNIENKMLKAILKKNSYSVHSETNPNCMDIGFYVSPLINGCIRVGTEEEHELLFRGLIEDDRGQTFKYTPRKSKNNPEPVTIDEDFYVHVARISANMKQSRQDKLCKNKVDDAISYLEQVKPTKLVALRMNDIGSTLSGVLANKIANKIMKPTLVLRYIADDENGEIYGGSARNFNNSYIYDLKNDLLESGLVITAKGHASAFGITIYGHNVPALMEYIDKRYSDEDARKTFHVDFIVDEYLPFNIVREIYEMRALFSNFVNEPFVFVRDLEIPKSEISVLESKTGNYRIEFTHSEVKYVKFNVAMEEELLMLLDNADDNDIIKISTVGKPNMNAYMGKVTPQFIIEDYECEVTF